MSARMIKLFNQSTLASLLVGAMAVLFSATVVAAGPAPPGRDDHQLSGQPADTFVILLKGIYQPVPVGRGPQRNLGLSQVDLSDGSYSKTKIYRVAGLPEEHGRPDNRGKRPGERDPEPDAAIGTFYVQFEGVLAAYDIPGGALTMEFTGGDVTPVPDGQGGTFFVGTYDLDIKEATGTYQSFAGGSNHMVDILHQLPDGTFDEYCFCIISRP